MLSYLADLLCLSVSRIWEYLRRIAEIEIDVTTLGVLLRTVRLGLISRIALEDMIRVSGEGFVLT